MTDTWAGCLVYEPVLVVGAWQKTPSLSLQIGQVHCCYFKVFGLELVELVSGKTDSVS